MLIVQSGSAEIPQTSETLLSEARELIVNADAKIIPILVRYAPQIVPVHTKSSSTSTRFNIAKENAAPITESAQGAFAPWPIKMLLPITSMMDFSEADTLQAEADIFILAKSMGKRLDGATMVYKAKEMKGEKDSFVEVQHNKVIDRLKAMAVAQLSDASPKQQQDVAAFIERVYENAVMPVSVNSQNISLNANDERIGRHSHPMLARARQLGLNQ